MSECLKIEVVAVCENDCISKNIKRSCYFAPEYEPANSLYGSEFILLCRKDVNVAFADPRIGDGSPLVAHTYDVYTAVFGREPNFDVSEQYEELRGVMDAAFDKKAPVYHTFGGEHNFITIRVFYFDRIPDLVKFRTPSNTESKRDMDFDHEIDADIYTYLCNAIRLANEEEPLPLPGRVYKVRYLRVDADEVEIRAKSAEDALEMVQNPAAYDFKDVFLQSDPDRERDDWKYEVVEEEQ